MRARTRLLVSVVIGGITGIAIPADIGWACRVVGGWDAAALTMSALSWWRIARADAERTRQQCAVNDPGGHLVSILVIVASGIGLLATAGLLRDASIRAPSTRDLFFVLCLVAIASSWMLTHTMYAIRYAHLYYESDPPDGLVFPGGAAPSYLDFAYLAGTIGMTFQVSDVMLTATRIRSAVLLHGMLSFAYSAVILATAVNVMLNLLG